MEITTLDIELTQRCNLRCPYCYLGQVKAAGTIGEDVLDNCIELLDKFGKHSVEKPLTVNFYGGEPLLAFDRIRYFVENVTVAVPNGRIPYRYTALSNGTIADEPIIAYCREHKISVQRSLDGCPEAMAICRGPDALQQYTQGSAAWGDFKRTRRTTVLPETAKYLVDDLLYFRSIGFRAGFSPMPDYYSQWQPEHVEAFKAGLWRLGELFVKEYREKQHGFYLFWFDREFARFQIKRGSVTAQGCGAGLGLLCVAWTGHLYLCHRFTSEPVGSPFCFGHIGEVLAGAPHGFGGLVEDRLAEMKAGKRPLRCRSCVGQYGCNVCCHHSNWKCSGKLGEPPQLFCELKRESAKVVTWIDNQLRQRWPNWWRVGKWAAKVKVAEKQKPESMVK